jgi:zinc protease
MEVILKETTNRNNEISFYALARGGTMSAPPETYFSAELASEMINASGLGPYTRPELVKMLADKQVSFSQWTNAFYRGFQGSAASGDIKVLMEMIYLGFTQARIDPDQVSILLEQMRTRLVQEGENPDSYFSKEITKTIYGNPRFHPIEIQDLEKVNIDDALAFIRRCQNPQDYTLVFTGNLNAAAMRPLVETYLASVPVKENTFNQWDDVDYQRPGKLEKELRKGREERSAVYISWFVPQTYSEEASAAASVLGEYLDIRLTDEIRENMGGVYSISPWVSLSSLPRGELSAGIYFVCNPGRAKEIAAASVALIREAAQGNINLDTLTKAREALVQSHEESIQWNSYIAQSYSNSAVIYRSPLSRLDKRPDLYHGVTAESIQYIAALFLEGGPVQLILYPEGWN